MLYLLSLFPPLAFLVMGRPISALVSFIALLVAAFLVAPAVVIYPACVVASVLAARGHRRGARPGEWRAIGGLVQLAALFVVASLVVYVALRQFAPETLARFDAAPAAESPIEAPAALPTLEGMTFAQVVAAHGEPTAKDSGTGLATWPDFQARFEGGQVAAVLAP